MNVNVGALDRALRVTLGIALLTVFFTVEDDRRWLGLIGIVPIATAFLAWCPLYTLLGIRTCR